MWWEPRRLPTPGPLGLGKGSFGVGETKCVAGRGLGGAEGQLFGRRDTYFLALFFPSPPEVNSAELVFSFTVMWRRTG